LTLRGLQNDVNCTNCTDYNGGWVLQKESGVCGWYIYIADETDTLANFTVSIGYSGGVARMYVTLKWSYRGDAGCIEGNEVNLDYDLPSGKFDCQKLRVKSGWYNITETNELGCFPTTVWVTS
jgi:hypothetical protein